MLVRSFDWSNRNRLYLTREWLSWREWFFVVEFGNGNSDPVWSIGVEVRR